MGIGDLMTPLPNFVGLKSISVKFYGNLSISDIENHPTDLVRVRAIAIINF